MDGCTYGGVCLGILWHPSWRCGNTFCPCHLNWIVLHDQENGLHWSSSGVLLCNNLTWAVQEHVACTEWHTFDLRCDIIPAFDLLHCICPVNPGLTLTQKHTGMLEISASSQVMWKVTDYDVLGVFCDVSAFDQSRIRKPPQNLLELHCSTSHRDGCHPSHHSANAHWLLKDSTLHIFSLFLEQSRAETWSLSTAINKNCCWSPRPPFLFMDHL